jgi:hypothetical protein
MYNHLWVKHLCFYCRRGAHTMIFREGWARWLFVMVILGIIFPVSQVMGGGVNLTWIPTSNTNVTGYEVYYGTSSSNYDNWMFAGKGTNVIINGLTPGMTYYFNAASIDVYGERSEFAGQTSYTVPSTFLACQPITGGVNLTWPANTNPKVTGYEFYYGSASGVYTNWTYLPASATNQVFDTLMPGVTYYFNAVTLNASGKQSAYVGEVSYTMPSPALVCQQLNATSLELGWPVNSNPNVTGYEIYYGGATGVYTNWTYVPAATTNLIVSGLTPGLTYYFNALTLNGSGGLGVYLGEISTTMAYTARLALSPVRTRNIVTSMNFTATGQVPNSWVIQMSTNFVDWVPFQNGVGQTVNVNLPLSKAPQEFFRLVKR